MFADGGAVTASVGGQYDTQPDMRDGGNVIQGTAFKKGGKVTVSNNPDAMLMDVHDKKFGKGGAIKKGLQAIQETLSIAEREANLAKFLEESKVKEKLYRGTRKAPKATGFKLTNERATPSFTTDPEVANVYSKQLDWDIAHGSGSTSVPVYTQMTNPLDIRKLGEHVPLDEFINQMSHDLRVPRSSNMLGYEDLADMLENLDTHVYKGNASYNIDASSSDNLSRIRDFEELADEIRQAGQEGNVDRILYELLPEAQVDAYVLADSPDVVSQLSKQGHDAIIHKDVFDAGMPYYEGNPKNIEEGYDAQHIIDAYRPFNQTKIKSAIGNRGTYDTTDPDITKHNGGLAQIQRK
jgi:hypothetical protein